MERVLGKKAQHPGDAIMAIVFLLILTIGGVIAFYAFDQVFDSFATVSFINGTTHPQANASINAVFTAGRNVNNYWDYLIFFVFIGMAIAMLVLGYFIDVHSIFMPFYIVAIIIGVVVSFILGYVWEQLADTSLFSSVVTDNFKITNHLLTNLGLYFTILAVLSFIAVYAKPGEA